MRAESRFAHDGVVTDVEADCSVPSESVSVTWNVRVERSHSQVRPVASEAVPVCVLRTPTGAPAGAPETISVMVTEGAVAPCTVSPMQPTVAVVAASVSGPPSLPGVGFSDEQGAFDAGSVEVEAPAVSVTFIANASARAVIAQ